MKEGIPIDAFEAAIPSVRFTEEEREAMRKKGMTDEEIDEKEKDARRKIIASQKEHIQKNIEGDI